MIHAYPFRFEPARRFGQPRLPNPHSGSVLVLNTEHFASEHFLVRYPWPTLRRRYGPVLATLASSLTDFHVRRSDAIRAPGLAWAATSMIAAGYQSISSCQSQRQPALQAGQARQQVGRGSAAIHLALFRLILPRGGL